MRRFLQLSKRESYYNNLLFKRFNSRIPDKSKSSSPPEKLEDADTPLTETVRDFLDPADFYKCLKNNNLDFFTGVPDSLLKDFCAYISDHAPPENHIITANEGASIGVAAGYHMATKKYPVVYMQNSGFGNTVNPLLSLADPKVYSIPMLLLIGWRGEPGKKDEPQHMVQGKIMSGLLADMNIRFEVLPDYLEGAEEAISSAMHHLQSRVGPYAFLVKRQTFMNYKMKQKVENNYELTREEAIGHVVKQLGRYDIIVSTTGFASRELYEYREQMEQDHSREFLTVGSMGHASAIAYGIASAKGSRQVICLDGDGALMMHMGTMTTIGTRQLSNFKHIVINNACHDSVGGQPTQGFDLDILTIAKGCGYKHTLIATNEEEIKSETKKLLKLDGPAMLELRVKPGARSNLGRPKHKPVENKVEFMKFLER